MRWGIASRFAVIFSLLVLLATATVGFMVYRGARDSLMAATAERLQHTAEMVQIRLTGSVEGIGRDLRFLGSTPQIEGIVRARTLGRRGYRLDPQTAIRDDEWREQLAILFSAFLSNRTSYRDISFVELGGGDPELVRVYQHGDSARAVPEDSLLQFENVSFFAEAKQVRAGQLYLSPVQWRRKDPGQGGGRYPLLSAAYPVAGMEGEIFGFIVANLDFTNELKSLNALVTQERSLYMSTIGGELLVHPDTGRTFGASGAKPYLLQDEFPRAADMIGRSPEEMVSTGEYGETATVLSFFSPVYINRGLVRDAFIVGVTSPPASFLGGVHNVRDRSFIITLLFCLGGVILTLGFAGYLTRPLSRITQALTSFGEPGWDGDLPTQRTDEIGVLARTFKTMAGQINRQMQELEEKEHRQRIILETSAEGIIVTDAGGKIETFNRAAERIFGFTSAEVLGRDVSELLAERKPERAYVHHRTYPPQGPWKQTGGVREVTGRRNDGASVPLSLAVSSFDIFGERKYASFVQDITERKSHEAMLRDAKEKAEEMARLKTAFLANMSHEIRTPLTSVLGYASLLAREVSQKQRRFAELIIQSGRRLMDTLNSVLSLAQLEARRVELELLEADICQEVREVVQMLHTAAEAKGLSLTFSAAPGAADTRAKLDRGAFSSVLQNLIGNAIKFTEKGGVEARVERDREHVYVHIKDTGVGIDASFLPHLFDEFRQESTGLSRSHEGNGLGLSITKRLTELLGGRIQVQSTKGHGSTFTVSFPLSEREIPLEAGDGRQAMNRAVELPRLQILLVEDNPDTAQLVEQLLVGVSQIWHATSGDEAVQIARDRVFDLVLMDINLGSGPNGAEVLEALRELDGYSEPPVIAITAYALPGDQERFLSAGFSAYLSKPFGAEELFAVVSKHTRSMPATSLQPSDREL